MANLPYTDQIRWNLVSDSLTSKPIQSIDALEQAINIYRKNQPFDQFTALRATLNEMDDDESRAYFFGTSLPNIIAMAMELPTYLPKGVRLLEQGTNQTVTLNQKQIGSLLANAFLCTYNGTSGTNGDYPTINFDTLLTDKGHTAIEKLKCLLNYLDAISDEQQSKCSRLINKMRFEIQTKKHPYTELFFLSFEFPINLKQNHSISLGSHYNGSVTFARRNIHNNSMPDWGSCNISLDTVPVHITHKGTIETNQQGMKQVIFSNRVIGGSVLYKGCLQEEIRFITYPELLISRLFVQNMLENECVIVKGIEHFCKHSGYGAKFQFEGVADDKTPFDALMRRETTVICMDAYQFGNASLQFKERWITRELNKVDHHRLDSLLNAY